MSDDHFDEESLPVLSSSSSLTRLNDSIVRRGLDLSEGAERATKARRELALATDCFEQAETAADDPTAWDTWARHCRDTFSHGLLAIALHLQMDPLSGAVEFVKHLHRRSNEVPAGTPPRGFPGSVAVWVEGFERLVATIEADREEGHRMWAEVFSRLHSDPYIVRDLLEYATELIERPEDAIARASPDPDRFFLRSDGLIEVKLPASIVRLVNLYAELADALARASSRLTHVEAMPARKRGADVTKGTVVRWLKSLGDFVEYDEVLCVLSISDPSPPEGWSLASPAAGVITAIVVPEGQPVAVSGTVCLIDPTEQ